MVWTCYVEEKKEGEWQYRPSAIISYTVNGTDYARLGPNYGWDEEVEVVDCGNGKVRLERKDGFVACEEGHWLVFRDRNLPHQNWEITMYKAQTYGGLGSYWLAVDNEGYINLKRDGKWLCFRDAERSVHSNW